MPIKPRHTTAGSVFAGFRARFAAACALIVIPRNYRMNVCLVEDDPMIADEILEAIASEIDGITVQHFSSERCFYDAFNGIESEPPLLFIVDVMLPWAFPSDSIPLPPEDVLNGGIMAAGLRVVERIRRSEVLEGVPVILHTALGRDDLRLKDLPSRTLLRQKSIDLDDLMRPLRAFLSAQRELPRESFKRTRRAGDAVTLAPEFMGMSVDLKKLWQALTKG